MHHALRNLHSSKKKNQGQTNDRQITTKQLQEELMDLEDDYDNNFHSNQVPREDDRGVIREISSSDTEPNKEQVYIHQNGVVERTVYNKIYVSKREIQKPSSTQKSIQFSQKLFPRKGSKISYFESPLKNRRRLYIPVAGHQKTNRHLKSALSSHKDSLSSSVNSSKRVNLMSPIGVPGFHFSSMHHHNTQSTARQSVTAHKKTRFFGKKKKKPLIKNRNKSRQSGPRTQFRVGTGSPNWSNELPDFASRTDNKQKSRNGGRNPAKDSKGFTKYLVQVQTIDGSSQRRVNKFNLKKPGTGKSGSRTLNRRRGARGTVLTSADSRARLQRTPQARFHHYQQDFIERENRRLDGYENSAPDPLFMTKDIRRFDSKKFSRLNEAMSGQRRMKPRRSATHDQITAQISKLRNLPMESPKVVKFRSVKVLSGEGSQSPKASKPTKSIEIPKRTPNYYKLSKGFSKIKLFDSYDLIQYDSSLRNDKFGQAKIMGKQVSLFEEHFFGLCRRISKEKYVNKVYSEFYDTSKVKFKKINRMLEQTIYFCCRFSPVLISGKI